MIRSQSIDRESVEKFGQESRDCFSSKSLSPMAFGDIIHERKRLTPAAHATNQLSLMFNAKDKPKVPTPLTRLKRSFGISQRPIVWNGRHTTRETGRNK